VTRSGPGRRVAGERPRSRRFRALALLFLAACNRPVSEHPLRFETDVDEVALGARFELSVVRTWDEGGKPVEWESGALALRLRETEVREAGGRVEETRRYDAYAFSEIDVPGLDVAVRRAVDPAAPGDPERPAPPRAAWPWWVAAALVLLAGAVLLRRRRPAPGVGATPEEPPRESALDKLAALRARDPAAAVLADELAALLRGHAGVPSHWSTEEVRARRPDDGLPPVLAVCDRVKFARHVPAAAERADLFDRAEAFLERGGAA